MLFRSHLEELIEDEPEKPPVEYGEQLPPLEHYPESIEDHQIYPLFGHKNSEPLECETSLLSSLQEIRKAIRESGRQLQFSELGIVLQGVMYGGHLVVQHMVESGRAKSRKAPHAKDKKLTVSTSA